MLDEQDGKDMSTSLGGRPRWSQRRGRWAGRALPGTALAGAGALVAVWGVPTTAMGAGLSAHLAPATSNLGEYHTSRHTYEAASAIVTSATTASTGVCPNGTPVVTVDGQATVDAVPDMATISVGVEVTALTAEAAITTAAVKANAVIKVLEADGILAADIQTSNLSVSPNYNANGTKITGYEVDNDLSVEVTKLSNVGSAIDSAAASAGNAIRIGGIIFSVLNTAAPMARARSEAVQDARVQATAMAAGAGEKLGPLCSLTDNSTVSPPPPLNTPTAQAPTASTPVQPGTEQMTADVTAVYKLVPSTTNVS